MPRKKYRDRSDAELNSDAELLEKEMMAETDRGCILVAAAALEDALAHAIRVKLRYLSSVPDSILHELLSGGGNPVLGTFHSRTLVAYALGIIDEPVYKALNLTRDFRNSAAHHTTPVKFDDHNWEPIISMFGPESRVLFESESSDLSQSVFSIAPQQLSVARRRFQLAVAALFYTLGLMAKHPSKSYSEIKSEPPTFTD